VRSLLGLMLVSSVVSAEPLPAHYAPLFERGKSWVYDTSLQYFGGDEDPKTGKSLRHTDHDKVTCSVVDVTKRAGATISHITCNKDLGRKLEVAGYWIGTTSGLWRFSDPEQPPDADAIKDLEKEPPRIAARPVVFEKLQHVGSLDPKHDTVTIGVRESPKIHGWCAYEDSSNADPDGGRVVACFGAGVGIESGYNDIGGSLNKFEFTVRP
jgi:hypothetical protein